MTDLRKLSQRVIRRHRRVLECRRQLAKAEREETEAVDALDRLIATVAVKPQPSAILVTPKETGRSAHRTPSDPITGASEVPCEY
jgi:hypothetical protein